MADPPNPARTGELWNLDRLAVLEREIGFVREFGVLSGGWAWHYLSPPHVEAKRLHDHKDIDLMVDPEAFAALVGMLGERGYSRVWTRFDDPSGEFVRWARHFEHSCPVCVEDGIVRETDEHICVECGTRWPTAPVEPVKVILDLFVSRVPAIVLENGVRVVEPATLLGFYGGSDDPIHSSGRCLAVLAARELLAAGRSVVGDPALVGEWRV